MTELVPEWEGEATVPGKSLGQIGYEEYVIQSDGKSLVSGEPLPPWHRVNPAIQDAWVYAAYAIARVVKEDR